MNTSVNVRPLKAAETSGQPPRSAPLPHYADRLLRLPDVMFLTGLGKTSIYNRCKEGSFPAAVDLGSRAVAWRETEVQAWIQGLQRANSVEDLAGSAAK